MDIQNATNNPRYRFDTFSEFLDFVSTPSNRNEQADKESITGDVDFTGTSSYEEATNLITNGWKEGLTKISTKLVAAQYKATNPVAPRLFYDVAGAYPNVAMAVAGDPCSMVNFGDVAAQARPVVRLLVNVGASAAYSADDVMNRGLAVLAHAARLLESGRSVGIDVVRYSTGGYSKFHKGMQYAEGIPEGRSIEEVYVTVKRPEEDMELDRLAFVLGHPSFLRRFMFFMAEANKDIQQTFYGTPADVPADKIPSDYIYFPCMNSGKDTKKAYGESFKDLDQLLVATGKVVDANLAGIPSEMLIDYQN